MAFSSERQSLIPSYLYTASFTSKPLNLQKMAGQSSNILSPPSSTSSPKGSFMVPSPSEPGKIELYSPQYYAACTAGGYLSDFALLSLLVIDSAKYKSISTGSGVLFKEQVVKGLTLLGYSARGGCRFGFDEYFKKYYSDLAGPENASKYKTVIYLAGSASAEVIADIALCPFEAVKVHVQTQPGFARGMGDGFPMFVRSEGYLGLCKGLVPLWGPQIPYYCGAHLQALYPCTQERMQQASSAWCEFCWCYIAGVLCTIVYNPADNLGSFLNNAKGATVGDDVKKLGLWGLFTRGLPLRIFRWPANNWRCGSCTGCG